MRAGGDAGGESKNNDDESRREVFRKIVLFRSSSVLSTVKFLSVLDVLFLVRSTESSSTFPSSFVFNLSWLEGMSSDKIHRRYDCLQLFVNTRVAFNDFS